MIKQLWLAESLMELPKMGQLFAIFKSLVLASHEAEAGGSLEPGVTVLISTVNPISKIKLKNYKT
jgi:hypothetical protein